MSKPASIVLVEDNSSDIWALKLAIADAGLTADINILSDGEEALNFIEEGSTSNPDLLILDLNLPRLSGHAILERLKQSNFSHVPVLVVTSSDAPSDRDRVAEHTPHYFRKPLDFDEFMEVGGVIRNLLARPSHAGASL